MMLSSSIRRIAVSAQRNGLPSRFIPRYEKSNSTWPVYIFFVLSLLFPFVAGVSLIFSPACCTRASLIIVFMLQMDCHQNRHMATIAEGVEFDTIAREWRCKWSPDDDKKSLVEAQKALTEVLDEIKSVDGFKKVDRVVCGGCMDFKVRKLKTLLLFCLGKESSTSFFLEFFFCGPSFKRSTISKQSKFCEKNVGFLQKFNNRSLPRYQLEKSLMPGQKATSNQKKPFWRS